MYNNKNIRLTTLIARTTPEHTTVAEQNIWVQMSLKQVTHIFRCVVDSKADKCR